MKLLATMVACVLLLSLLQCQQEQTLYVSIDGNDLNGEGSTVRPWRTLAHALSKIPEGEAYVIKLSAGTFVEKHYLKIPPLVSIKGDGIRTTIIKADSTLFSHATDWNFDKYLFILNGPYNADGNQTLSDFTIDGSNKNLYGGILVKDRNYVVMADLAVNNTSYVGIWLWGTANCKVSEIAMTNCAWGSSKGCSAALQFTASSNLEIDHVKITENIGYGMKAVGDGKMYALNIHDSQISVNPNGQWKTPSGNAAPNIACELYNVDLKECTISDNYFNASLSVAMDKAKWTQPANHTTIRIFDNTFDMMSGDNSDRHGLELTLHNVEVHHNYFAGGSSSIVNWDASQDGHTMHGWKIHHNVFYKLTSFYPSAVINFFRNGIHDAHIYNNTVELDDASTINFIEVNNEGTATNVRVENNLIINSSGKSKWYPNKLVSIVKNARFVNSVVSNNSLERMQIDTIPGIKFRNNLIGDPKIQKTGERPSPYYRLLAVSPLVDRGLKVDDDYEGQSPDIGALEFGHK